MNKNNFSLEVLVNGRPVREYSHNGLSFIQANGGTQYSLLVRNNTFKDSMVVASVDGLDAITGERADEKSGGYIVKAWSSMEIKGFRVSDSAVGAFLFTEKAASYAEGKGEGANTGVIAVRLYEEKPKPQPVYQPQPYTIEKSAVRARFRGAGGQSLGGQHVNSVDFMSRSAGVRGVSGPQGHEGTACSDYGASVMYNSLSPDPGGIIGSSEIIGDFMNTSSNLVPEQEKERGFDMGTSWGQQKTDRVIHVNFDRGVIVSEMAIYYASKASLQQMGVKFYDETPVAFPQPFSSRYAKPPVGWKG